MLVQLRYPCLPQNSWTNPTKSIALKWLKRFWRAPFPVSTTTAICLAECSVKLRNKTDDNTSRRIANTNTAIKSNYSCLCLARTQHFQKFCNLHFCSEITIDIQNAVYSWQSNLKYIHKYTCTNTNTSKRVPNWFHLFFLNFFLCKPSTNRLSLFNISRTVWKWFVCNFLQFLIFYFPV